MNNYYISKLNIDQYYLICMDCNSILNYVDQIEAEYAIRSNEGELIVDQLLVAGNGKNRFLSCLFSYGEIKLGSAKNIEGSLNYKKITSEVLCQYYEFIKYSILTKSQLERIKEGSFI